MFANRSGAVRDIVEPAVLTHFGALLPEQRAVARGGVIPRADLAVLTLSGGDRLRWLDSICSQSVQGLQPGEPAEALILDPHGHIQFVLRLLDDGEQTRIIVSADQREAAANWLNSMRFRADVALTDDAEAFELVTVVGSPALAPESFGAQVWTDPWPAIAPGGFAYGSAVPDWQVAHWMVPVDRALACEAAIDVAGIPVAGMLAWNALRIAAGRPEPSDIDERSLPHEFDWLRTAVHLSKGCYRGQETVAKVHNLGRPPRRLVLLHLDGSDTVLPHSGDEVWASRDGEPRSVGSVVAAALHWELGPIALALVKRAMPADTPLTVQTAQGEIAASQDELVPSDAGPAVELPRLPRIAGRH